MATMSKSIRTKPKIQVNKTYGRGRGKTEILELQCTHTCRKHYKFVQQAGWGHHFLPVCDCKENMYFQLPNHIDESQYEMYMELATTKKNILIFIKDSHEEQMSILR